MASTTLEGRARERNRRHRPPLEQVNRIASRRPSLRRDLVAIDVVALLLAWGWLPVVVPADERAAALGVVAAMVVGSLVLITWQRLYLARVCSVRSLEIVRLGRVTVVTIVVALLAGAAEDRSGLSPALLVGHALLAFALLVVGRGLFGSWLRVSRTEGRHVRNVALVGWNDEAEALACLLEDEPQLGYRVTGVVCPRTDFPDDRDIPWLGPVPDAIASLAAADIGGVIVVVSAVSSADRNRVVRSFFDAGIHVQVSVGLERVDWRRLRALPLAHEPLFYVEPPRTAPWRLALKRVLDVVLGAFVFVVTAPLVLIAAGLILVTDGRPVLYRQVRVGRDGRPFTLLKLRTMCRDAEARLDELQDANDRTDGPLFKMTADPRVTTVGRILRASSIDELPQLVNVLRGEMSLVGPRPALAKEVEQFDVELQGRFRMRPGISGLWQVEARDNPSFRVYRHLDLFYLENWTLTLDLAILVATVELLVGRTIARACAHLGRRRHPEPASEPSLLLEMTSMPAGSAADDATAVTHAVPVASVALQRSDT
jgi:exopolysaccharide biosynthesis polyprenyl glycosylphosphotransferase